jgi:hypothetical protein
MKKHYLFILTSFTLTASLSAQITREQADNIVYEYIQNAITQPYYLYAKDTVFTENGFSIDTGNGEFFSIRHPSWIYCLEELSNDIATFYLRRYLFVNKSNGNLFEVKTTANSSSDDRMIRWEVMNISTGKIIYHWKHLQPDSVYIIRNQDELRSHVDGPEDEIPAIDFENYSLIVIQNGACNADSKVMKQTLKKTCADTCKWYIDIAPSNTNRAQALVIPMTVPKLSKETTIKPVVADKVKSGKIVGYIRCYDLFGLFIITDTNDSLLTFSPPPVFIDLDKFYIEGGVHGVEDAGNAVNAGREHPFIEGWPVSFIVRMAEEDESLDITEFLCAQFAYSLYPEFHYLASDFSQAIITNINKIEYDEK